MILDFGLLFSYKLETLPNEGDAAVPVISKKPGIEDVAREAGVSLGSVSRVLNNDPRASARMRTRVLEVIRRLRYTPNSSARMLARARSAAPGNIRTGVIGFAMSHKISSGMQDPYMSGIFTGLARELSTNGMRLVFEFIHDEQGRSPNSHAFMLHGAVDGVVVAGAWTERFTQRAISLWMPVVLAEAYAGSARCTAVLVDNYSGGFKAVERLLKAGHRRIGIISGPRGYRTVQRRFDGCAAAFARYGFVVDRRLVQESDFFSESGATAMKRLMRLRPRPTAVFAMNDNTALGAIAAARSLHLRVPHDVSIIGFDDIAAAALVHPGLTTVAVSRERIGELAALRMTELLSGRAEHVPAETTVPVHIVERHTVRTL